MSTYQFQLFMDKALNIIKTKDGHPLKFLLRNETWIGRWPKQHEYSVQAGHAVSKFSGLPERFMVEDAAYNQMYSTPERKKMIIIRHGILIEEVPVERETARYWMQTNKITKEVFEYSEPTIGWE